MKKLIQLCLVLGIMLASFHVQAFELVEKQDNVCSVITPEQTEIQPVIIFASQNDFSVHQTCNPKAYLFNHAARMQKNRIDYGSPGKYIAEKALPDTMLSWQLSDSPNFIPIHLLNHQPNHPPSILRC